MPRQPSTPASSGTSPRVTLGLPVYNGADYIKETLASVRDQTFTDWELIVSDNQSTDETAAIVGEFAAADERIRLVRHPENIGSHNNYNSIVPQSGSEYFKWVAHDDLLAPTYLERCVAGLEEHPESVLAFTNAIQIDENGEEIGVMESKQNYRSSSPYARMRAYVADRTRTPQVFGLFRRSALIKSHLLPSYPKSDTVFMCEMAMLGPWVVVDEPLFLNREHPDRQGRLPLRDRTQWYFPSRKAPLLPRWDQWGGMISVSFAVRMPLSDKLKALGFAGYWGLRHSKDLLRDLAYRFRYEASRTVQIFKGRST